MNIILLLEPLLSFSSICFSSCYIFLKIKNYKPKNKQIIYLIASSIFSIIVSLCLREISHPLSLFTLIILIATLLSILKIKTILVSLLSSIISICMSYCLQLISAVLSSFLFFFLINQKYLPQSIIVTIIFQITATIVIMHFKRIKNGLSFFQEKNNLGFGLFITGFFIIFVCLGVHEDIIPSIVFNIFLFGGLVSSIGLFLWIRKSITDHYRKRLQAKADEHYQNTLSQKDEYIEQLSNSNAYLSKVVHRDNHLMSSLKYSIEQYKNCNDETEKQKILDEILTLTNEREDLLIKEQKANKVLQTTGSAVIDGALGNMYIKAVAHNIDFSLAVNDEIHYLINNLITQTDLETLLCDHIKDAIIAIDSRNIESGKILVTIGMIENIHEISIKDNGIDFDIDTLSRLGLERVTTHKDTGGSGIGFMTTFETLNKTGTSLIITEYENKVPFSKSITFRFDGLNNFIVRTYRSDVLKTVINRNDMIIIPTN